MIKKTTFSKSQNVVKIFDYDMIEKTQESGTDDGVLKFNQPKIVYNYICSDGSLKTGYGFSELKMPMSTDDLDSEYAITIKGSEVKSLWSLVWNNKVDGVNHYYLFYYNDNNKIYYEDMLYNRVVTFPVPGTFSSIPCAVTYRKNGNDYLFFSSEEHSVLIGNNNSTVLTDVPKLISCISHYGMFFAISYDKRAKLIYSQDCDILNWSDEKTKDFDFSDERGQLTKLISYEDYIYIFRDFGITKLSLYGSKNEFSISHMYKSDSYIYPNSICQSGDNIFFLTRSGLKIFNGSSVKDAQIDCQSLISSCDNSLCSGACFEGKYYLACRADFQDDSLVGCEGDENGYSNNILLVYDISSQHADILRGVDIKQVFPFLNPYKSKLLACFSNENCKGKIGQLNTDGQIFGENEVCVCQFAKTDFGYQGVKKRVKSFDILSKFNCKVLISNETTTKTFNVKANAKIQKINVGLQGKLFVVKVISSGGSSISNLSLTVAVGG